MNTEKMDVRAAHDYFSKQCFNSAWDLIEKGNKAENEILAMIHTAHASVYHWLRRVDCTDQNLSIGYWQLSHMYALIGEGGNAFRYAEICKKHSKMHGVASVFLGYAYEALARALSITGNQEDKVKYLEKARQLAQTLPDDDREQLLGDLADVK